MTVILHVEPTDFSIEKRKNKSLEILKSLFTHQEDAKTVHYPYNTVQETLICKNPTFFHIRVNDQLVHVETVM